MITYRMFTIKNMFKTLFLLDSFISILQKNNSAGIINNGIKRVNLFIASDVFSEYKIEKKTRRKYNVKNKKPLMLVLVSVNCLLLYDL